MKRAVLLLLGAAVVLSAVPSCGMMGSMMAGMMGMGDKMSAMKNQDKIDDMSADEKRQHADFKEAAAWQRGKELFNSDKTGGGKMGASCNTCHPGGGTTGGEAQIPMREFKMPIPSLVGSAASFPKYKVPNDDVITLQQMNNNCNRMFMGGSGLDPKSTDAWALEKYVASLSNGETVSVGGQMGEN